MYYIGYPKGPSHTTVVSEFLFRPGDDRGPGLQARAGGGVLGPDQQAGLGGVRARADRRRARAPSRPGVYPRQDRFLYWFNEEWRLKMGREPLG